MKGMNTMSAALLLQLAALSDMPESAPISRTPRGPKAKTQADFNALANAEERRQRRNAKRARKGTT